MRTFVHESTKKENSIGRITWNERTNERANERKKHTRRRRRRRRRRRSNEEDKPSEEHRKNGLLGRKRRGPSVGRDARERARRSPPCGASRTPVDAHRATRREGGDHGTRRTEQAHSSAREARDNWSPHSFLLLFPRRCRRGRGRGGAALARSSFLFFCAPNLWKLRLGRRGGEGGSRGSVASPPLLLARSFGRTTERPNGCCLYGETTTTHVEHHDVDREARDDRAHRRRVPPVYVVERGRGGVSGRGARRHRRHAA